jgi:hypothetical protein
MKFVSQNLLYFDHVPYLMPPPHPGPICYTYPMRRKVPGRLIGLIALALAALPSVHAQQQLETFHWMNFRSFQDQDIIVWVTRSLAPEKWTSIREIGVKYDAALVVTTLRASAQSPPNADTFTIWTASLTNHTFAPLLSGVNLRMLDWLGFTPADPQELGILYDNCRECATDTYFTAFYYDMSRHGFTARWMRGGQGVPLTSANMPPGVALTQIYAGLAGPDGRQFLATWNHFDFGKVKPPEDYIYRYDIDQSSGLDRTAVVSGKDAEAMKQRLCNTSSVIPGLAGGQDSALCLKVAPPRPERKPVTTPPANNIGHSAARGTISKH